MNTGMQSIVMMFVDKFKASRLFIAGFLFSIFAFASFGLATNLFSDYPRPASDGGVLVMPLRRSSDTFIHK